MIFQFSKYDIFSKYFAEKIYILLTWLKNKMKENNIIKGS